MSMTETNTEPHIAARELTDAELADVNGGSISHIAVAAISLVERINLKFLGCTTSENGLRACSYTHDNLPDDM